MHRMILTVMIAASLSVATFADDAPQAASSSSRAVEAAQKHDMAIKEAKEAYLKAVIAADQQYVAGLDAAMKAAMLNQNIDLARDLEDQKKAAAAELKAHQADFETDANIDKSLIRPTNWNPSGGDWSFVDGNYRQNDPSGVFWNWAGDPGWTDYEVQANIRFLSETREASLGFRATGTGDAYYFCLAGGAGRLALAKIINGIETFNVRWIPWNNADQNRWYNVRVQVKGRRILAYLDNEQIFDFEARDVPGQGCIGLRTFHTDAQFKDVMVKPLRTPN